MNTTHKPFGPKIAKMLANVDGYELAYRGMSARSWADARIEITDTEVVVRDTKTGHGAAYRWTGRKFAYLGAR